MHLLLLISLITLTLGCEVDDGDDYSSGTCECPDMRTLLNTTRESYKNPTVTRLVGCTYNFTCHCTNSTSELCGYLAPKTLSNVFNLPTDYNLVDIMDAFIQGDGPQNIFETFGIQCTNGSWFATKLPYQMWFKREFNGEILQGAFMPEDLVNTTVRIPEQGLTC